MPSLINFPNDSRNYCRNIKINIRCHEMPPPLNQNLRLREYNSLLYCPNSRNETFAFQKSEMSTVYVGSAQNGFTRIDEKWRTFRRGCRSSAPVRPQPDSGGPSVMAALSSQVRLLDVKTERAGLRSEMRSTGVRSSPPRPADRWFGSQPVCP